MVFLPTEADRLYAWKTCDLLSFNRVTAEPKVDAHDPASPAAAQSTNVSDDALQVFKSHILSDSDIYDTSQFRLFSHVAFLSDNHLIGSSRSCKKRNRSGSKE